MSRSRWLGGRPGSPRRARRRRVGEHHGIVRCPGKSSPYGLFSMLWLKEHVRLRKAVNNQGIPRNRTKGPVSLNDWRSSHHPIHVRAVLQQELDRVAR